jgi:hypothetical protein
MLFFSLIIQPGGFKGNQQIATGKRPFNPGRLPLKAEPP